MSGKLSGRDLRSYFGYSSQLHCSGHCEISVIIETYIGVGYNLTAVLNIILILSVLFKQILIIINWLVLVYFALNETVHHKRLL